MPAFRVGSSERLTRKCTCAEMMIHEFAENSQYSSHNCRLDMRGIFDVELSCEQLDRGLALTRKLVYDTFQIAFKAEPFKRY